jgi:hypothetical protein
MATGKPTLDQLKQHVLSFVPPWDYTIEWCSPPSRAKAAWIFHWASLPYIRSLTAYAIAMHEIGHLKGRYQSSRNVLTRERWAWQWARQNALVWTARMEQTATQAMNHYVSDIAADRALAKRITAALQSR